eukprot:TRINITY_DN12818_c0_g1_i1.p1 TRINITY_DN12818_c0_g1~~TRINITY_DN12818_c0_g1_i1.p1  ORF type:complete len:196 (+),score=58.60 TRINITY_DN12818_c0_g1_i1:41-628(+)
MSRFIVVLVALAIVSGVLAQSETQGAKKKAGLAQLESVLIKESLACDKKAQPGDTVAVHYTGKLQSNGKVFDSSRERGQPITFELGSGRVIQGWDQGIQGMCPGESRRLTIPPHLAYGDRGAGDVIPPGATLVFDVELVSISRASPLANVINWEMLSSLTPVFIFAAVGVFFVWRASQVEKTSSSTPNKKAKKTK